MKQQIARLSPHQNAKVVAVISAVWSLIFVIPMAFFMLTVPSHSGASISMFYLSFPIFYLLFGYIFTVIGCWIYNAMFKVIGGIEYDAESPGS